ncbi:MAG: GNAT family protein [bacterium]|nr:GNAT family protein [bacterium]
MSQLPFADVLEGQDVRLERLEPRHMVELKLATMHEILWQFAMAEGQDFAEFLQEYLTQMATNNASGDHIAYVVIRKSDGRVLGSTRFYDISAENKRLAIGYTWYIPEAWGGTVNPETKLLLLGHAFEELGLNRVEFHVDSRNSRSVGAMTKLGAKLEGMMRQHKVVQGDFVRDTVLFSVTKTDWPHVKTGLLERLTTI